MGLKIMHLKYCNGGVKSQICANMFLYGGVELHDLISVNFS